MAIDIAHVAKLARLDLTPEELALFGEQLDGVLRHIEILSEVDTGEAEPMVHAIEQANVFRPDTLQKDRKGQSLLNSEALANAPESEDGFFIVPRVVE